MLCEVYEKGDSFLLTWLVLTFTALTSIIFTSGPMFYYYYARSQVTYEKWRFKINPKFPSPEKVRDEIIQMLKGVATAAVCPAISLWLTGHGRSQAYCGFGKHGWGHLVLEFALIWIGTDFWSFFYHRLGHTFKFFWAQHKHHHVFFNPSPFAVIADEYFDQFWRAAPMFVFPLVMPICVDLMFFEFAVFFYVYGVYLHWGYELPFVSAHQPILNTSFQHYCHHAKAIIGKPYHCGFFFKIWDQLSGGMYKDECFCSRCSQAKGLRTPELFAKVEIPDYSVLLKPSFWFTSETLTGKSARDQNDASTEEERYFASKGTGVTDKKSQ
eukprot:c26888_g1_i1.p1 GENE.c26888_g1_i1~~c26888_g1_i1.p1  ORF type:complete len:326 (+),score=75.68 c26888_g1_i1:61-1038(+)